MAKHLFRQLSALIVLFVITATYYIYVISFIHSCRNTDLIQPWSRADDTRQKYLPADNSNLQDPGSASNLNAGVQERGPPPSDVMLPLRRKWDELKVDPQNAIGNSTTVLLLAYQRTGSTLAGSFFNVVPDIFYVYEPLDSVYVATYGIQPGWSVPSDLFTLPSGKERVLPQNEQAAMRWTLERIWSCDFASLPISTLLHPFWFRFLHHVRHFDRYVRCLEGDGLNMSSLPVCIRDTIEQTCGQRFNPTFTIQAALCSSKMARSYDHRYPGDPDEEHYNFESYFACLESYRGVLIRCLPSLLEPCRKRSVRVIKTVRTPMNLARRFLEQRPDFKLIHVLRDPLGVVRSRYVNAWSRGFFDAGDEGFYGRAATVYCQRALRDILDRTQMERDFPGQISTLVFDQFADDPEADVRRLFGFVGIRMPPFERLVEAVSDEMLDRKLDAAEFRTHMRNIATRWQDKLPSYVIDEVKDKCKELYQKVDFGWNY